MFLFQTLACILSNKCPDEEYDGSSVNELFRPQVSLSNKLQQNLFVELDTNLRCFCGLGIGRDSCWLWCENCSEPMHAKCANFDTVEAAMTSCRVIDSDCGEKLVCDFNRCPLCYDTKVKSRATLIITPPAILTQWQREISRHVDDRTKTNIYHGLQRYVHPLTLADNDIVLTTFDTLITELSHSCVNPYVRPLDADKDEGRARSLRTKKRYRVVPSPLIRIRWWRIVLDEAQRVETPTALSAKMALQLDSVHRWCVTGKLYCGKLFPLIMSLRSYPPFICSYVLITCSRHSYKSGAT